MNSAQGESGSGGLAGLEKSLIAGTGRGMWCTSMLDSLTDLIKKDKIDARSALKAVSTGDEKKELVKLIKQ
jgi:hypothetical protein